VPTGRRSPSRMVTYSEAGELLSEPLGTSRALGEQLSVEQAHWERTGLGRGWGAALGDALGSSLGKRAWHTPGSVPGRALGSELGSAEAELGRSWVHGRHR
jgi:hypothetical protein